ncbi:MAG TPA: Abi-alpha family protein [Thermoleophilaceae bacterium]|nr:Abi-alpha family protein [Thermoleophilaceae bacterium]
MSEPGDNHVPEGDESLLRAAPGLARIAAVAALRTARWGAESTLQAYGRVLGAAVSGEPPGEVLGAAGAEMREYARRLLGLGDIEDRASPPARQAAARAAAAEATREGAPSSLRQQGAELLRKSADVRFEEDAHPAYARILSELAPDEGRILRMLALEGPQAAVDVRAAGPLYVTSQLVAPGLSMIGPQSGCRHLERVPAYLNNLFRLGLVWFSREAVPDISRYQVLEAQPEVADAMRKAGRARTVRRSIHLTPFGVDFCQVCLPLETAEIEALPREPPDAPASEPPA